MRRGETPFYPAVTRPLTFCLAILLGVMRPRKILRHGKVTISRMTGEALRTPRDRRKRRRTQRRRRSQHESPEQEEEEEEEEGEEEEERH